MSKSAIAGLKSILSTGEHADVHFLLGDGDAKERVPAHKFILKNASKVFAAMFRFDSQNANAENDSANRLTDVEIPDVEAAAFKVMLSFIYMDDLSGLNGDNAMAVLYATENRRAMLGPALFKIRFPLLSKKEFVQVPSGVLTMDEVFGFQQHKIQPNFSQFPSEERIRTDGILLMDIEKVSEFAGADVRSCRFSKTFHIKRLPWKIMAQITTDEDTDNNEKWLGIYLLCDASKEGNSVGTLCDHVFCNKSNNWGFGNFISIAQLVDPFNGFYNREEDKVTLAIDVTVKDEKMDKIILDQSNSKWTIEMEIEKVSEFNPIEEYIYTEKWLGIYLLCVGPKNDKNWSCKCSPIFQILSQKSGVADYKKRGSKGENVFYSESNSSGFPNFASFAKLMDPSNDFYNREEDKMTLAIDFIVKDENPVVGDDSDYTESLFCWSSTGLWKFGI
ncbi:hypothetical protein niasHS_004458 [Heterodera schachtii]|uniref:BTB domain-containing protein n=1 Tax=Heterodera schachtii TaxID=97005 RepID=A0ABD2JJ65_HETSC